MNGSLKSYIIIFIILALFILMMFILIKYLLKDDKDKSDRKKTRSKKKKKASGKTSRRNSAASSPDNRSTKKNASRGNTPEDSQRRASFPEGRIEPVEETDTADHDRLPSLKAVNDEAPEKYAKITSGFLSANYSTTISKLTLRKYFSEVHGFQCVDFVYEITDGMSPADFKENINGIDLALSNVSGVDTLTFPVSDLKPGVFKTTFYLNK